MLLKQWQMCLLIVTQSISKWGVSNNMVAYLMGPPGIWTDLSTLSVPVVWKKLSSLCWKKKKKIIELVGWKIAIGTIKLCGAR